MTISSQSSETSPNINSNDSSRARAVEWLDENILKENPVGLNQGVDTSSQENSVEIPANTTEKEKVFSHSAGAIAVNEAFQEIMTETYSKSDEVYGDLSADPWAGFNNYDPLFDEMADQVHETTSTNHDSHKSGFDIDG